MKKVVIGLVIIVVVASFISGAAYAWFSDTEQSTNNQITAGTLDLKTNDADGVTATLSATTMKPSDTQGPSTITLRNVGSINGATLDIDISYSESDNETLDNDTSFEFAAINNPSLYEKTADEFADELVVDTLTYEGANLLTGITDTDADGIDMKEVAAADLTGQSGLNASQTKDFVIQVTLKSGLGNEFQADGIDITITFTLNQ